LTNGQLASGSHKYAIKIWDTKSWEVIKTLTGHKERVIALAVVQDGLIASSSSDKTIKIWNTNTGQCHQTINSDSEHIYALATLKYGWLASGDGRTIKIWDTYITGLCIKTLEGHKGSIKALTYLHNKWLASGSEDNTIKIWDIDTGQCIKTLVGHKDSIKALTYLHNEWLASGSEDNTIKIWDIDTGQCIKTLVGHKNTVKALTCLDNRWLASVSSVGVIKIWDTNTWECINTLETHDIEIFELIDVQDRGRSNGWLACGSTDDSRAIKIWNYPIAPTLEHQVLASAISHGQIDTLTFLMEQGLWLNEKKGPRGRYFMHVAVMQNQPLMIEILRQHGADLEAQDEKGNTPLMVALNNGYAEVVKELLRHGANPEILDLESQSKSPEIRKLIANYKTLKQLLNKNQKGAIEFLKAHDYLNQTACQLILNAGEANSVLEALPLEIVKTAFEQNDLKTSQAVKRVLISAATLGKTSILKLYHQIMGTGPKINLSSSKLEIIDIPQIENSVYTNNKNPIPITYLPSGEMLTYTDDYQILIWDTTSWELKKTLDGHEDSIKFVASLPNGNIISGTKNRIKIWDHLTGECLKTHGGHESQSIATLPNGYVAIGHHYGNISIWDTNQDYLHKTLKGHNREVSKIVPLSNSLILSLSAHEYNLRIWNLETGQCKILEGHTGEINDIAIISNERIASCSGDSTIKIWSIETGKCIKTLEGHRNMITSIEILKNDDIVSGSKDGTIKIWKPAYRACMHTLKEPSDKEIIFATLPNGQIISHRSGENTLEFWDSNTGKCLQTIQDDTYLKIHSLTLTSNGNIVCELSDGKFKILDYRKHLWSHIFESIKQDGKYPLFLYLEGYIPKYKATILEAQDKAGNNILDYAFAFNNKHIMNWLYDYAPELLATFSKSNLVHVLLDCAIKFNRRDTVGWLNNKWRMLNNLTLHLAVKHNQHEIINFRLTLGADVDVKDMHGKTPYTRMIESGRDGSIFLKTQRPNSLIYLATHAEADTKDSPADLHLAAALYRKTLESLDEINQDDKQEDTKYHLDRCMQTLQQKNSNPVLKTPSLPKIYTFFFSKVDPYKEIRDRIEKETKIADLQESYRELLASGMPRTDTYIKALIDVMDKAQAPKFTLKK